MRITIKKHVAPPSSAEPSSRTLPRTRQILFATFGLGVPLLLQWMLVAIPTIEPALFDRLAVELERSSTRRYGYVLRHHGAILVKARLEADAPPFVPRRGNRVAMLMTRELKTAPLKAVIELGFYAVLFALGRHALRRAPWIRAVAQHRLRWSVGVAVSTVILVTVAMAPYLAIGYGEPLFSTRQGPGALTYSGIVPITAPIVPAVSYGVLLQSLLIWPLMAMQWAAEPLSAWLGIRGSLWLVAAGFWAVAATIVAQLAHRDHARVAPRLFRPSGSWTG